MSKSTRKCTIEGCNAKHYARGYCSKHYRRWYRYGDPLKLKRHDDPEYRFLSRAKPQGDCLTWAGTISAKGYAMLSVNCKVTYAHRYAWEREHGPIPEGLYVDHTCHRRDCVNVEHLRLATPGENSAHRDGPTAGNQHSGVRNVHKNRGTWEVAIVKDGHKHSFGFYKTVEEAKGVAEQERARMFGEFAGRG